MASSARIDEIKKKFDENPRRYFAPLANEFRKAGDLEQAIVICEEFLPQQAGHMSGHIVYGQALYESGRLPESRTVFETALGLDPENLIALRHLGDIARSEGDLTGARRWYDRVLEADPRNEEIQGLLASLDAGGAPVAAAGAASWESEPQRDTVSSEAATVIVEAVRRESAAAPPPLEAIDLDLDGPDFEMPVSQSPAPLGQPVVPPPIPESDAPFESISLDGLEPTNAEAATAATMPEAGQARAEGLEPSEFEAPTTSHVRAEGLEPLEFEALTGESARAEGLEVTSHEPVSADGTDDTLLDLEGSFELGGGSSAPEASDVPPVAGLEEPGATQPAMAGVAGLPMLDVDGGPLHPDPRMEPPAAMEAMPALTVDDAAAAAADATGGYMELPPAVIAAESELMDAGDLLPMDAATPLDAGEDVAPGAPPFVTETMAELYLKQGFREQALVVFRQLSAASPHDARLLERVASLEQGEAAAAPESVGPTVREFFFRLATRRPGERSASAAPPSNDDFAAFDAIPVEPVTVASASALPVVAPEPELQHERAAVASPAPEPAMRPTPSVGMGAVPSPAERGATAQGDAPASGSIDALFGTRAPSTSEDSAASALAQAFGGTSDTPAITGRPARAATGELSLDSVFRDGPARPARVSQSFSFDQFFSDSASSEALSSGTPTPAAGSATHGEPAERTADDVQQFNSWLQGLKQQ